MITVSQLRAARGLVGWNQARLAEASGLALSTIKRMEGSNGTLRGTAETGLPRKRVYARALELAGDPQGAAPGRAAPRGPHPAKATKGKADDP